MKFKDKFLIGLLTVVTFGFCWVYWKKQHKKKNIQQVSTMALPGYVNLNELITLLGEKANITEVDATLSNLKLAIQDRQKVNLEALKNLKYVSGIMAGETKITLVVGDIAQSLKNELAKLLTA